MTSSRNPKLSRVAVRQILSLSKERFLFGIGIPASVIPRCIGELAGVQTCDSLLFYSGVDTLMQSSRVDREAKIVSAEFTIAMSITRTLRTTGWPESEAASTTVSIDVTTANLRK
jgi:hypothetical protein